MGEGLGDGPNNWLGLFDRIIWHDRYRTCNLLDHTHPKLVGEAQMKYRYATANFINTIAETVGIVNITHPHWDIVSIQQLSSHETVIVHRIPVKEEEPHRFATVTWSLADIEALRPDWSELQCAEFLKANERRVVDLLIPRGWEILEELLDKLEQADGATDE